MMNKALVLTVLLPLLTLPSKGGALGTAMAVWEGNIDSNWNIAGNWSNRQVPGSKPSSHAVIEGRDKRVCVPTPVAAANGYSVEVRSGGSLSIERDLPHVTTLIVGDGASKVEQFESNVAIAGDLRVGGQGSASEPGEYRLRGGALSVGGMLDVRGRFTVEGAKATVRAQNALLASGSVLKYDFDLDGVGPIKVEDRLTITDRARIEVDLRGNTVGGNLVKLLEFSSLSGSFQPQNIIIRGQKNGELVYSKNAISVRFEDQVDKPETTLWFNCGALDPSGADPSLCEINTGRRIRNLTSPDLHCGMKRDGQAVVYHVAWTGSDVDADGTKEAISFDLRVEGFTGSTVDSDDAQGSMTALGNAASPSFSEGDWGVGQDGLIGRGETLRFSIENIKAPAGVQCKGFVCFKLDEPRGGNAHVLVIGQGDHLPLAKSSRPQYFMVAPTRELLLTSANNSKVAVGPVFLNFTSRFQPDTLGEDVEDYSTLPNGPYFRGSYPPQADQSNFPAWSWDRVQRWGSVRNGNLDPDYIQAMAHHLQIAGVGNTFTDGAFEAAAALKKANPKIKILFYTNTGIFFGNYTGGLPLNDDWFNYTLDGNGKREYQNIRKYKSFNHSYPELRQWWARRAADAAKNPYIDGIFIDKASAGSYALRDKDGKLTEGDGHVRSYVDLVRFAPANALIIGNTLRNERDGGSRELMNIFSGSYVERWERPSRYEPSLQTVADARVASIQIMREAALKGKILMPAFHDRIDRDKIKALLKAGNEAELKRLIKQGITVPLAYYLIIAEKYSYFRYQPEKAANLPLYVNDPTELVDELTRPLGPPLGPPKKNGYVYTRSFTHVDVWLNVETNEARLDWH